MRKIKQILSLMLAFVIVFAFGACSKKETPPPANNNPGTEQGGGNGAEEVYVPYSSSEIMSLGSNYVDDFFADFEVDLTDEVYFDDNINGVKSWFGGASNILESLSDLEGLTYGKTLQGSELEISDYANNANRALRFLARFSDEDVDGNAKVEISVIFDFKNLDNMLNYDFYYFVINTNKKTKDISVDISIERSRENGVNDSVADYYNISLTGKIGGGIVSYDCYKFKRTEIIDSYSVVSGNNIDKFQQSKFIDGQKSYISEQEAEENLRNPASNETSVISSLVNGLNAKFNKIYSGKITTNTENLSESLVICIYPDIEII